MKSRWYELKSEAIRLREKGFSIRRIEKNLGIPRSTLSGWLKEVKITQKQKNSLLQDWKDGLTKARQKAIIWHNTKKEERIKEAKKAATETLNGIDTENTNIIELALAFLYLGEGTKKSPQTALGSSNPNILKFFLSAIQKIYGLDVKELRYELYLRADQKPDEIKAFWSKALRVPTDSFKWINIDKRTKGIKTYPDYKGVCSIQCGHVAIQRKLLNLANLFSQKITEKNMGV